jgi:GxxExxY protein
MHNFDELSYKVIGVALRVHKQLGPGLFESVYHSVFYRDLRNDGLFVESKKVIPFKFEGMRFSRGFVADLIVERALIIEVKSVKALKPVFEKQLQTYCRLTNCRVGLLINFNVAVLPEGIKRIVNNF